MTSWTVEEEVHRLTNLVHDLDARPPVTEVTPNGSISQFPDNLRN